MNNQARLDRLYRTAEGIARSFPTVDAALQWSARNRDLPPPDVIDVLQDALPIFHDSPDKQRAALLYELGRMCSIAHDHDTYNPYAREYFSEAFELDPENSQGVGEYKRFLRKTNDEQTLRKPENTTGGMQAHNTPDNEREGRHRPPNNARRPRWSGRGDFRRAAANNHLSDPEKITTNFNTVMDAVNYSQQNKRLPADHVFRVLEEALDIFANDENLAPLLYELGRMCSVMRDHEIYDEKGLEYFEQAYDLDANYVPGLKEYARLLKKTNNFEGAEEAAIEAIELAEGEDVLNCILILGDVYQQWSGKNPIKDEERPDLHTLARGCFGHVVVGLDAGYDYARRRYSEIVQKTGQDFSQEDWEQVQARIKHVLAQVYEEEVEPEENRPAP